jgi:putative membrane protein
MSYFAIKALHVIGFVCWFAGLFYIVRLFIYHQEAQSRAEQERLVLQNQFIIMQRRLWYGITWPAMLINLIFGGWLLLEYNQWQLTWIYVKLGLIVLLVSYHLICGQIFQSIRAERCSWSPTQLRLWNEVATLLLVGIVFVAVYKNALSALGAIAGLFAFALMLLLAIRLYARLRHRR